MSVLIINGSPKKKLSMSRYIQKTIKVMLGKEDTKVCGIHTQKDIPEALEALKNIDALVIAAPLYIDSIPSHLMKFLQAAEKFCQEHHYHFPVYVLVNSGFIEGHQNEICLNQYECWAERAGLCWGGGVGIGGGVILGFFTLYVPIAIVEFLIAFAMNAINGVALVNGSMISSAISDLGMFLFFSVGMFTCELLLTRRIKKKQMGRNLFTRFMCPSCIFLLCADLFMLLLCIVKGGIFHNIFHREYLKQSA